MIRIPKTAMMIPQVKNRLRQMRSMSLRTVAFTTALSKDSETSRIERTKMIHKTESTPSTPPTEYPYTAPIATQTAVKMKEPQ